MWTPCNQACIQRTKIALLTKDKDTMAENIDEIKGDVSDIKKDMSEIKAFILTSPQKFADKEKTEKFMSWINLKLAFVSWIIWFALLISDKYF